MAVRLIDANDFMRRLTLDTSKGHYGEFMDGSEVAFTSREIARFVEEMPTIICPSCGAPHDGRCRGDDDGKIGADKMQKLTHLSLFSGIGGLDLAAEMAGFRTVGQCEWADYPTKVLEKHWPDVPRWRDIRTLTGESFHEKTGLRTVDIISGGFPCQPFSVAGKRRGKEDDRYLWPEMLRVIQELRPTWIVGENVSGLVRDALGDILESLEKIDYYARAYTFTAEECGALFKGERIAIVAASNDRGAFVRRNSQFQTDGKVKGRRSDNRGRTSKLNSGKWWEIKSRPYGVADGVPYRVDRLKCLGNAVVPQQFYPIFQAIADIERGIVHG